MHVSFLYRLISGKTLEASLAIPDAWRALKDPGGTWPSVCER